MGVAACSTNELLDVETPDQITPDKAGSAVGAENHAVPRGTAFVVELPPGALAAGSVRRYARALLRLAATRGG